MPEGASSTSDIVIPMWQGAWIAAMVTGVLVWGLIGYAVIKFRRRSDDEIPIQTRYNLPMEILYTIAPIVMVLVFFNFVVKNQNDIAESVANPDHVIKVVGQQWSWSFNYVDDKALDGSTDVYQVGTPAEIPTLYLPVDESVRFELSSPDVLHAFWVPAFSYKMDVIPGQLNTFDLTPNRIGTFAGKCSELCGVYHSRMLFNVQVVTAEEYAQRLQALKDAGNVGIVLGQADATAGQEMDPGANR